MRAPGLLLAAALLAAAPVQAESLGAGISDAELEGHWIFEAEPFFAHDITQEISGEMEIVAEGDGNFSCTLWVADHIPEENVVIRTEQLCAATREGDTLHIDSFIVTVDPVEYWFNYVPDNFTLTIESGRRMIGVMHADGADERPGAVFVRDGALVS